jgi:hypothetical protein
VDFTDFSLDGTAGILLDDYNASLAIKQLCDIAIVDEEKPSSYEGIIHTRFKPKADDTVTVNASRAAPSRPAPSKLDAEHEKFKLQYIAACSARNNQFFTQAREALVKHRQKTEPLLANLILEMRAAIIEERKARGESPVDRGAFANEFDALLQVPKVRTVSSGPGTINIYTEMLHCADPSSGKLHEIGECLIKIYIDGHADGVRWFNLTRRTDALLNQQQAPSVLNSGRACFSDIRENFPDLIASMQFSTVALLAIAFIEQLNAEDLTAEQIIKWPVSGR